MLVLTRRAGEKILIGDDIEITVVDAGPGSVRIGISAPRSTPVHRAEILAAVANETAAAVRSARGGDTEAALVTALGLSRSPDAVLAVRPSDATETAR